MLKRRNMNNNARPALDHPRKKLSIQANCRQQIHIESSLPIVVRKCPESTIRSLRSAKTVHENIQPMPLLLDAVDNLLDTLCSADVCLPDQGWVLSLTQWGACRRCDRCTAQYEPTHDRLSRSLPATRDSTPLPSEF